jgi:hypothetical protein
VRLFAGEGSERSLYEQEKAKSGGYKEKSTSDGSVRNQPALGKDTATRDLQRRLLESMTGIHE